MSLLKLSGREVNTFMAMLIDFDVQLFAALKMGFISAGLLFKFEDARYSVEKASLASDGRR